MAAMPCAPFSMDRHDCRFLGLDDDTTVRHGVAAETSRDNSLQTMTPPPGSRAIASRQSSSGGSFIMHTHVTGSTIDSGMRARRRARSGLVTLARGRGPVRPARCQPGSGSDGDRHRHRRQRRGHARVSSSPRSTRHRGNRFEAVTEIGRRLPAAGPGRNLPADRRARGLRHTDPHRHRDPGRPAGDHQPAPDAGVAAART